MATLAAQLVATLAAQQVADLAAHLVWITTAVAMLAHDCSSTHGLLHHTTVKTRCT